MLNVYARQVLMHALHARNPSVDQVASYVAIIEKYNDGVVSTIPCPRCYADGRPYFLILSLVNDKLLCGSCDGCAAAYDLAT